MEHNKSIEGGMSFQMKRNAKAILAALLVAVTLFGLSVPAFAAVTPYNTSAASGYVQATEAVNIRKGPGTSYARIGWLQAGAVAIRTGTSGNWTEISLGNGTYGYVSSAFLRSVTVTDTSIVGRGIYLEGSGNSGSNAGSTGGKQYYATTALNLRKGPGTNYARIGWLEKGESVTLISVTGKWAKVNWKGTECYAFFKYLKQGSGSNTNGGSTTVYNVTNAAVVAYYGPGTNYAKAGTLQKGARIDCLGTVGAWTMIAWDKAVAYIPTYYVTTATNPAPNPGATTAGYYTTTQNVISYRGPGTNYASAGTLLKGLLVQVISVSDGWALINLNGQAVYVQSRYLQWQGANNGNGSNGGSGGTNWWHIVLDEADSTLVSFVREHRDNSAYGFKKLDRIYVTKPPRGYEFRTDDFSFSGSETMTVTFRSQTNSDKATFIWYRNPYVCPDNYGYWNRFVSGGITYYFAEHQALDYSEAYWWYGNELFYARVSYSFTRSDALRFFESLHRVSLGNDWN